MHRQPLHVKDNSSRWSGKLYQAILNDLDEEEFDMFVQYHLSTCERADLMGASAHTVDILRV